MARHTTDDGLDLYYELESSDAHRPTVVFLNGMTQSTEHWATHVRAFREHTNVLTYDARGQGQSDIGEGAPSLERHVADLRGLLDHLDLGRVDLVGFSHGARIALAAAARHADHVRKLVLCSVTAEPNALARTIVRSWKQVLERGGLETMIWAALPDILGNDYLETHEPILEGIVEASLRRNSTEGVRRLLEGLETYPLPTELAPEVEAPTLVLSGTDDPLVDAPGAEQLAETCGGRHHEIDGTGHTIPIEVPERFQRLVTDFLND